MSQLQNHANHKSGSYSTTEEGICSVTMATVWAPVHSVLTLHLALRIVSETGERCRQFYFQI